MWGPGPGFIMSMASSVFSISGQGVPVDGKTYLLFIVMVAIYCLKMAGFMGSQVRNWGPH